MSIDINFSEGNDRFNFRVATYITHKDTMLVQGSRSASHHNLIGGRVKMGENTFAAVKRELKEELDITDVEPKLIQVAENSFNWLGKKVQELVFIYHLEVDGEIYEKLLNTKDVLDNDDDFLVWIKQSEIKTLKCLPDLIYDLPNINLESISHTLQDN